MDILYTKRTLLKGGLSERQGPLKVALGYFLFVEADCHFGILPPYNMLNRMLAKGKVISPHNTVLEWKPMRLSRLQYDELKDAIDDNPAWGGEVDDCYRGSRIYWERWAILRSVDKMSARPSLA